MNPELTYENWRAEHHAILERIAKQKIIVTYSGGKDSSAGLYLIHRAAQEFDFDLEVHAAIFPQHVITPEAIEILTTFWRTAGIEIQWHAVPVADEALAHAVQNGINPCLVCNQGKKTILMDYCKNLRMDLDKLTIMMSYSLWDLVSATIEHILNHVCSERNRSSAIKDKTRQQRFLETSQRFYPLLRLKSGLRIFKPLIRYNDPDIMGLIERIGIPLTAESCAYRNYRPKRLFAHYYQNTALRFNYEQVLAFARESVDLPDLSYFEQMDMETYLGKLV